MIYLLSHPKDPNYLKKFYGISDILQDVDLATLLKRDREERLAINNDVLVESLLSINYPLGVIEKDEDYFHPKYREVPLSQEFFKRDAKDVARELLGKIIMVKKKNMVLAGKIVETEAYYGPDDPASRAYHGRKNYNKGMWLPGGHIFIYMVHANWMFNITTGDAEAQAVLIRAVEPLIGLNFMYSQRGGKGLRDLCSGPGKWSRAFGIERDLNEKPLGKEVLILNSPWRDFQIKRSHRIGVTQDVEEPLRFFIPSKFTSTNRIL